jgi:hypothetical protein
MVNLEFPKQLRTSLYKSILSCRQIDERTFAIELVHQELDNIAVILKKLKDYRDNFIKTEGVSVINLSTVPHSKKLDPNGCVLIKIQEHILSITVAQDVTICDDYKAEEYSINKIDNIQLLYRASTDDYSYHKLIGLYMLLKNRYQYKIGNRIHLKTFEGMYKIIAMDHKYVTISCNKWQQLGKPNKQVLIDDIKCLAGGLNSLNLTR